MRAVARLPAGSAAIPGGSPGPPIAYRPGPRRPPCGLTEIGDEDSRADLFRRAATYVDKILRGARPADLPIEQPTLFDFALNLRTAQALGLAIPSSVQGQATEVIQ
jgi:hypothetical protein